MIYPNLIMYCFQTGRVLRLLATLHIFREVSLDTFANNRVSSLLDSGKTVQELQAWYSDLPSYMQYS